MNTALSLTQHFTNVHYNRAVIFNDLGNHDKAITNYSRAIELQPDFAQAYYERGLLYQQMGLHEQAKIDFKNYLALVTDVDSRQRALALLKQSHLELHFKTS